LSPPPLFLPLLFAVCRFFFFFFPPLQLSKEGVKHKVSLLPPFFFSSPLFSIFGPFPGLSPFCMIRAKTSLFPSPPPPLAPPPPSQPAFQLARDFFSLFFFFFFFFPPNSEKGGTFPPKNSGGRPPPFPHTRQRCWRQDQTGFSPSPPPSFLFPFPFHCPTDDFLFFSPPL